MSVNETSHARRQLDALAGFADDAGVETGYWDVLGSWHDASPDALLAVLAALGHVDVTPQNAARRRVDLEVTRARQTLDPMVVAWAGEPLTIVVRLARTTTGTVRVSALVDGHDAVVLGAVELGEATQPTQLADDRLAHHVSVSAHLPIGEHRLVVSLPGSTDEVRPMLCAPRAAYLPDGHPRWWGVFAPLYALRSGPHGPSVRDLDRVGAWIAGHGGTLVATLPLLAAFLDEPFEPSPYAPISRAAWNELYLDLDTLPAYAARPQVQAWLASPAAREAFALLRAGDRYDYAAQARARNAAIAAGAAGADVVAMERDEGFDPGIADFARFRAGVERWRGGWRDWPEEVRSGRDVEAHVDAVDVWFHEFAQHAVRGQLRDVATAAEARGQSLYLDLPVGAHRDGYDTWRHGELFAQGVAAGAPPDEFFTEGQNWGFPPMRPDRSRLDAHRHLREVLRHHMEVAGVLRIDHVMGLHRLYWVPDGMGARDGVYVRYPREELMAAVTMLSHQYRCVVVGEDLGTVPDEVRAALTDHRLLGMHVGQFAVPQVRNAALDEPDEASLTMLNTHDTPPFAAWLAGLDIDRLHDLGLYNADEAGAERAQRTTQRENLTAFLRARGSLDDPGSPADLLAGVLRWLGDSPAMAMLVNLEDLWGETEPQNVPGTPSDRPNWVHRFPAPLDDMESDMALRAVFDIVQSCRLGSHLRAAGGSPHAD